MQLRPMLASLSRHRLTVLLLVLQVTFTCAIVCNVAFMIAQRMAQVRLPSGLAENELVTIESDSLDDARPLARHAADLAALRDIPGVVAAAAVDALPFNGNNWSNGVPTAPDAPARLTATAFNGTPGELATLGLRLLEGRDFLPGEYLPVDSAHDWSGLDRVPATIVTKALAERLFPGQDALGRLVYPGNGPVRIVGVVEHLLRPRLRDDAGNEDSMLFPMLPDAGNVVYVLRTSPQQRGQVLERAAQVLRQRDGNRIVHRAQTFEQLRDDYLRHDRTMIGLLLAAATGLLLVTAVGIAGLASFWVQQRRRAIGIRRAVGATRGDILRYFQAENFLIVGGGAILGMALAGVLNAQLMAYYELPRLPLAYLPAGAAALWLLGQLAVLGPALRAAALPPAMVMRGD
ncbi:ABC transporter permease [Frateuria sp. Soil773]|uniref:ABC transporter permease n=1 Tax=Frateuria sp. Soil773 TaxID=1736407 RepID=UPI0006FE71DF|nr:FtsX-like permease family protein [Frateuria sp. Soil773]KRF02088.1 ABC transporter permease [Frateuria sp. Soil773]